MCAPWLSVDDCCGGCWEPEDVQTLTCTCGEECDDEFDLYVHQTEAHLVSKARGES